MKRMCINITKPKKKKIIIINKINKQTKGEDDSRRANFQWSGKLLQ